MAKFRNNTGFNQVVIHSGSKHWVRKDWVIEAPESFKQEGFDRVEDNTPTTSPKSNITVASRSDVNNVESRLSKLENIVEKLNSTSEESVNELQQKIKSMTTKAMELEEGASQDLVELKKLVEVLSEDLKTKGEYIKAMQETVYKRLDILKTAMQAMETQMDQFIGYSEGNE